MSILPEKVLGISTADFWPFRNFKIKHLNGIRQKLRRELRLSVVD